MEGNVSRFLEVLLDFWGMFTGVEFLCFWRRLLDILGNVSGYLGQLDFWIFLGGKVWRNSGFLGNISRLLWGVGFLDCIFFSWILRDVAGSFWERFQVFGSERFFISGGKFLVSWVFLGTLLGF